MARLMDIVAVSQESGLSAATLRFYEEKGLIRSIGRRGLRRLFDKSVGQRLALIALGKKAGFSLDEIAAMFAANGSIKIDRAQLAAKADALEVTIKKLSALRDGLRHAAKCPAPSHLECPTFQRFLTLASKDQARPSKRAEKTKRIR